MLEGYSKAFLRLIFIPILLVIPSIGLAAGTVTGMVYKTQYGMEVLGAEIYVDGVLAGYAYGGEYGDRAEYLIEITAGTHIIMAQEPFDPNLKDSIQISISDGQTITHDFWVCDRLDPLVDLSADTMGWDRPGDYVQICFAEGRAGPFDWQIQTSPDFSDSPDCYGTMHGCRDLALNPGTYYWRARVCSEDCEHCEWVESPSFTIVYNLRMAPIQVQDNLTVDVFLKTVMGIEVSEASNYLIKASGPALFPGQLGLGHYLCHDYRRPVG